MDAPTLPLPGSSNMPWPDSMWPQTGVRTTAVYITAWQCINPPPAVTVYTRVEASFKANKFP